MKKWQFLAQKSLLKTFGKFLENGFLAIFSKFGNIWQPLLWVVAFLEVKYMLFFTRPAFSVRFSY